MRTTDMDVQRQADKPERGTVAYHSFRVNQRSAMSIRRPGGHGFGVGIKA
jgi:hypothetical protein